MRKIKFDFKIEFFKIKRTCYLRAKKDGGWKWTFNTNFKVAIYLTYFFHFIFLSFNSTLPPKKTSDANPDIVSKTFRSLPKTWKTKVTAIWEAMDLTKLSLDELIESLMTHEITMKKQELEDKPKKNLAFKTVHHVEYDDEVEKDIALITRQFWNFLRKKQRNRKFSNFKKDENKEEFIK